MNTTTATAAEILADSAAYVGRTLGSKGTITSIEARGGSIWFTYTRGTATGTIAYRPGRNLTVKG